MPRPSPVPPFMTDIHLAIRALEKLDVKGNMCGAPGFKHLAEALKNNKALAELNLSSNDATNTVDGTGNTDMGGVTAIVNAIPTMGALVKFNISNNSIGAPGFKHLAEGLQGHATLSELNIASNYGSMHNGKWNGNRDMSGVIAIGAAIPTMGALSSLNISDNNIGKSPAVLEKDHGLSVGHKVEYEGVQRTVCNQGPYGYYVFLPSGIIALLDGIKNSGAMTSLNLSGNNLGGHWKGSDWISDMSGIEALAAAIEAP